MIRQKQKTTQRDLEKLSKLRIDAIIDAKMETPLGRLTQLFKVLSDERINIRVITTSEIKISVLIDRKYMELAVQALHDAFELEKAA